jgi:hypothetical protein
VHSGGWWGVAFVLGLLVFGGMGSLPTAAQSGEDITAYYAAHRQLIIIQQIIGVLLVVPILAFARTLDRRTRSPGGQTGRWIMPAALVLVAAEIATNVLPVVLAAMPDASPATAHGLTLAADLVDAVLFAAIAFFSLTAALAEPVWVRGLGLMVVALTLIRAFASPMGMTVLDAVAPIAFVAYVLVLSTRIIAADRVRRVVST